MSRKSKVRIKLNRAGIRELLRSSEIADAVSETAAQVAAKCGPGYGHDRYMTPGRAVSAVFAEDASAMRDNLSNNTLVKAVSG